MAARNVSPSTPNQETWRESVGNASDSEEQTANVPATHSSATNTEVVDGNCGSSFFTRGYGSLCEVRRSNSSDIQERVEHDNRNDGDAEEDEPETVKIQSCTLEVPETSSSLMKQVNFFEKHTLETVPLYTKPRVCVRLTRAISSSAELNIYKENAVDMGQNDIRNISTSGVTGKRGGYFQKVRALFRPRSVVSLNNLPGASCDNSDMRSKTETHRTILRKTKSQTSITDRDVISQELKKSQVKAKFQSEEEVILKDQIHSRDAREEKSSQNSDRRLEMTEGDSINNTSSEVHKPGRCNSLIRRESKAKNSSHVNLATTPSMREHKVRPSLLHHFITTLPPDQVGNVHVIKDATHIQALDNGESVVTDTLSNNIILFDSRGHPKLTFSVDSGSEPWATCLTPEGGLAVTLKRQGCVSVWSTSGKPVMEFGQNVLSSPAGLCLVSLQMNHLSFYTTAHYLTFISFHGHFLTFISFNLNCLICICFNLNYLTFIYFQLELSHFYIF